MSPKQEHFIERIPYMSDHDAKKVLYTPDERFKFSCHRGLPCYNSCCRDINIFLTPYDVLRMRKGMGLSSEKFLQEYTTTLLGDDGIPLVVLKMKEDQKKTCPFVTSEGCRIYPDRPWSCRMFPVFPLSSEEVEFLIEEKGSCLGFGQEQEWTIREWKTHQNIDIYDRMNQSYKDITHHEFFQKGNKLDSGRAKLLYQACYDLDWFKKFLFSTRFFDKYSVEEDLIHKMEKDDDELLLFAYRWVKFSIFSEDTLRLRDKEMNELWKSSSRKSS
jgi:Fe-S-cluster containining protein